MSWKYPEHRPEPLPPPRPPHAEVLPHVILGEGIAEVSEQIEELVAEIRSLRAELAKGLNPQT